MPRGVCIYNTLGVCPGKQYLENAVVVFYQIPKEMYLQNEVLKPKSDVLTLQIGSVLSCALCNVYMYTYMHTNWICALNGTFAQENLQCGV